MRKHCKLMALRGGGRERLDGSEDRTNFPQYLGNRLVNDKGFQLAANGLLQRLLRRVVPSKPAPVSDDSPAFAGGTEHALV